MKEEMNFTIPLPNNHPNYKQKFICLFLLKGWFERIELEKNRIEKARKAKNLKVLFADIHFLLVPISNLLKIFQKLRSLWI